MGLNILEPLNETFRKYEYETDNCFAAKSLSEYVSARGIFSHKTRNNDFVKVIILATDDEAEGIMKNIEATSAQNLFAMETLNERKALLCKYFNYVETLDNCGLMLHMKATPNDTTTGDILTIRVNPGGDGIIKWDRILSMISWERKRIGNLPQYLREIYLMDKTYDDVLELADQINKRLDDCVKAINSKIKHLQEEN